MWYGDLDKQVKLANQAAREVRHWGPVEFKDTTRTEWRTFLMYHPLACCFPQMGVKNLWSTKKSGMREPAALGKYNISRVRFEKL